MLQFQQDHSEIAALPTEDMFLCPIKKTRIGKQRLMGKQKLMKEGVGKERLVKEQDMHRKTMF